MLTTKIGLLGTNYSGRSVIRSFVDDSGIWNIPMKERQYVKEIWMWSNVLIAQNCEDYRPESHWPKVFLSFRRVPSWSYCREFLRNRRNICCCFSRSWNRWRHTRTFSRWCARGRNRTRSTMRWREKRKGAFWEIANVTVFLPLHFLSLNWSGISGKWCSQECMRT